jgi:P4 family phage/plasmid primase-like protien
MEMREEGLNIGSLRRWAKEDDPEAYQNICFDKGKLDFLIEECLTGSHGNMAKLFRFVYGENIKIIAQLPHLIFAHWNEGTSLWTIQNKTVMINLISDIVTPYFKTRLTKAISKLTKLDDENDCEQEESLKSQIKSIQKMIGNLSSSPFLNNICFYYSGFELDTEFEIKLNSKSNELPIKNKKIINLKTKVIRERTKEDLFSFELDVSYIQDCNFSKVIDFFNGICCQNDDLVDYMKRLFGYTLTGEISDRSLHIFWGSGRNGKSTVIDILRKILGKKYFVTCSENVLLKSTSTSSTSPELIRIQGARVIVLSETDKQEKLNSKRIKGLTGGDEIVARQLFREQIEFNPQATPIMITNHKPEFDINDQAMIDRLKMVPFLGRFDNTPKNRDYIKDLINNHLDDFFSWFVDGAFEWYNGKELIPCQLMTQEMDAYINELDIQKQFMDERIDIISKENYNKLSNDEKMRFRVKKDSLFAIFVGYIMELGIRSTLSKSDFYKALEEKFNLTPIKIMGIRYYLCRELLTKQGDNE